MYHILTRLKLKSDLFFISKMLSSCHFILMKQLIENSLRVFHASITKKSKYIQLLATMCILLLRKQVSFLYHHLSWKILNSFLPNLSQSITSIISHTSKVLWVEFFDKIIFRKYLIQISPPFFHSHLTQNCGGQQSSAPCHQPKSECKFQKSKLIFLPSGWQY